MPDQDPQERLRQAAEDRMSADISRQIQNEMNQRFGVAPPADKMIYEAGIQGAATAKEEGDYRGYLAMLKDTQDRMVQISMIQRRESQAFVNNLRQVERLQAKSLKSELDHYNLIKNRRQTLKDIRDLEQKGFENLSKEQQIRIKTQQADLAQAKALNQAGVPASYIAGSGIGGSPGQLVGAGQGNLFARLATRRGILGYIGRQAEESGLAVRGAMSEGGMAGLTSAIPALIRANPIIAGLSTFGLAYRGVNAGQGLYIPGVGSVPFSDFQNQILAGRVTGEGYGAGLAARWEAFRMGLNPIDLITPQVANQIVGATRAQGFRGSQGRAYQGAIRDIYQQTGLPIDQIAQMGDIYARRQGGLAQFRGALTQIDDIARSSGRSVQTVAEGLTELTQTLVGQGAAPGLLPIAISRAVGQNIPGLSNAGLQSVQQFIGGEGLQRFSGLPGVMATGITGRRFGFSGMRQFLDSTRMVIQGMSEEDRQNYVLGLMEAGYLPRTSYRDALHFIRHGGQAINDFQHQVRQQRMDQAFAAGRNAQDRAHHDPSFLSSILHHGLAATDYIPGVPHLGFLSGSHHDRARQLADQTAYIHGLRGSLRGTRLTKEQIDKIVTPLERTMRGQDVRVAGHRAHLDWDRAVRLAQDRAKEFTAKPKGTLNIKLDAAETKRLLSGKNVQKGLNLQRAVEGAGTYVGTSLWDAMW